MSASIHACAIVVGERGVLIRGPSGAGKSLLSLAMIAQARLTGAFAAVVADDRVFLDVASGRLLARGAPGFEGLIESRGVGLLAMPHEPRAVLRMVVDLGARGDTPPRWPADDARHIEIQGVVLPRFALDLAPGLQEGAYAALRGLDRVA